MLIRSSIYSPLDPKSIHLSDGPNGWIGASFMVMKKTVTGSLEEQTLAPYI